MSQRRRAVAGPRPVKRYLLTGAWWALGIVAIYLIYDNTRHVIANDVLRALAAAALLLVLSIAAGTLLGIVVGSLKSRRP